jgi:hypothetical protein
MTKFRYATLSICFAIALSTCLVPVSAQGSLTITPVSIDTKIKAGASYAQNFTLTNDSNERLKYRSYANDMWYDEQNVRVTARAGTMPRSASLWIQFSPSEGFIEPHSAAIVKATITVPQNAAGSFYTVPVFETTPAGKPAIRNAAQTTTATTTIGVRFRGLMMLTTETGAEYNVEVMGSKITPPAAMSELELSLDLRNRGTAHAKVRGAYAILDSSGNLAGRGAIEEKRFLPAQRNFIKSKWSGELKPGDYTCVVTLSYNRTGLDPTSMIQEISFSVR